MREKRDGLARAVIVSIAGILSCADVSAQTMPFPFPMYSGNASGLSPTDSAALGTSANQTGNMFNNPWAAPFLYGSMFPMQQGVTGSTTGTVTTGTGVSGSTTATGVMGNGFGPGGMSTNQLGLMMLANQAQMGGIGSGQLSGVRPGPAGQSRSRGGKPTDTPARRGVSQPAGLAAHYFSRTTSTGPKRGTYYNRPSSHYPQATH